MRHKEIAKAWLDGKQIQILSSENVWTNLSKVDHFVSLYTFRDDREYRIKPKVKCIRFRNFLFKIKDSYHISITTSEGKEKEAHFIKWIGDWQTVEVEVEVEDPDELVTFWVNFHGGMFYRYDDKESALRSLLLGYEGPFKITCKKGEVPND